jgi:hypothetical protein
MVLTVPIIGDFPRFRSRPYGTMSKENPYSKKPSAILWFPDRPDGIFCRVQVSELKHIDLRLF